VGAAPGSVDLVVGDIRDPEVRTRALAGVQDVVHLAAIVGDPACAREPELARSVNYDATCALLEAAEAAGIERFVFVSTCSNYGRIAAGTLADEETELNPVSLYAELKVAAERRVLAASREGFACSCLRLATVYGTSRRMRFDLTVNEFTRDAFLKGELTVYGEQFWRPYIHVRDVARAVRLVLEAPVEEVSGDVFNVGATAENYRKVDLVDLLKQRLPEMHVDFVHRDEDPRDYRVSFEKIAGKLGYSTARTVAAGIDEVSALLETGSLGDPYAAAYRN
jgi:nucleoside-diphosphate-sugar epimerase